MQEFLKSEVDNVQRQIDSAVAGINIIVETIGPWKSITGGTSGTRNLRAGGPAANMSNAFAAGSNGRVRNLERLVRREFRSVAVESPTVCHGKMRVKKLCPIQTRGSELKTDACPYRKSKPLAVD